MKKTKLFIPLASLAGATTIIMPMCLTSCGTTYTLNANFDSTENAWYVKQIHKVNSKDSYKYLIIDSNGKLQGESVKFIYECDVDNVFDNIDYLMANDTKINIQGSGKEIITDKIPEEIQEDICLTIKYKKSFKITQIQMVKQDE